MYLKVEMSVAPIIVAVSFCLCISLIIIFKYSYQFLKPVFLIFFCFVCSLGWGFHVNLVQHIDERTNMFSLLLDWSNRRTPYLFSLLLDWSNRRTHWARLIFSICIPELLPGPEQSSLLCFQASPAYCSGERLGSRAQEYWTR